MEAFADVLSRALRQVGLEGELDGWRAVEEWPDLVGARIARHARAVAYREGILRVEVEGSAWLQELSFLKRDLLRRIHQRLGNDRIRDVRFKVPRGGILR